MKVRSGFVSNSSSSSFIIAVPKGMDPTVENFHRVIFGTDENKTIPTTYDWHICRVDSISVAQYISENVGEVIDPVDLEKHVDVPYSISSKISDSCEGKTFKDYDWKKYDDLIAAEKVIEAKRIIDRHPGHVFYSVEIGDATDWGSEVEHGPALKRPNVYRYSHH